MWLSDIHFCQYQLDAFSEDSLSLSISAYLTGFQTSQPLFFPFRSQLRFDGQSLRGRVWRHIILNGEGLHLHHNYSYSRLIYKAMPETLGYGFTQKRIAHYH
jgi:hypothetical protein